MKFRETARGNWKRKLATCALVGSTITGTFGGNERGLSPLYNRKVGNSYGINVGFLTECKEGAEHYGISLNLVSIFSGGSVNGLDISIARGRGKLFEGEYELKEAVQNSTINGASSTIFDIAKRKGDLESNLIVNGLEVGLINNLNEGGKNFQVGIYNSSGFEEQDRKIKRGIGLNYRWDEDIKERE